MRKKEEKKKFTFQDELEDEINSKKFYLFKDLLDYMKKYFDEEDFNEYKRINVVVNSKE